MKFHHTAEARAKVAKPAKGKGDFLKTKNRILTTAVVLTAAALLLSASAYATPLITAQPIGQTAFVGDAEAVFQVIENNGTSYQWQVKVGGVGDPVNVSGSRYPGYSTPFLRIKTPDASLSDNSYGCVVTDGSGSVTSAFAPLTVFAAPVATAPVVTLGASTIPANTTDDVSIQITGLATGQSVHIEHVLDLNDDAKLEVGEPLVQSFSITDGMYEGSTPNIPGDLDLTVNGQIISKISLVGAPELGRAQGTHLIRIISPTGAFLPVAKTLVVQGNSYGQSISGQVRDTANAAVGYSIVSAVQGNTLVASAVVASAVVGSNGNYNLWVPAGTYTVVPFFAGYTANISSQPTGTVSSISNSTGKNPILTPATATVAGRVLDASGSPALPGVQLTAVSSNGYVSILTSNSDGNYIIPTVPGTWTISASPASLGLLGYLEPATAAQATTTVGSVTALDLLFASASAPPASYATWKTTAGFSESDLASPAISGETADPDGDGFTNLLEYALGGSPKVADAATIAPAVDSDGSQVSISFRCDDSRKDLIYTVQSSTDLNTWTDVAQSTGGGPMTKISDLSNVTDPGTGSRMVTVSATLPVGGKLFLRVNTFK